MTDSTKKLQAITVWTDTHLFAPNEIPLDAGPGDVLIGDIVDLANCSKRDVLLAKQVLMDLCKSGVYIFGNHERQGVVGQIFHVINRTAFAHGDLQSNPEKWMDYRNKPHGAGWFKRVVIVHAIELAEKVLERPMRKEFLERASKLAKALNCDTYVCGHFHPKSRMETTFDGIKIVVLPRGRSEVDI